jgi:GTPase SAR1 family protein
MNIDQELLDSVVADIQSLRGDYDAAGLFDETRKGSKAACLLGEGNHRVIFNRTFLWTNGLLHNYVARELMNESDRLRHVAVFGGTKSGKSTCVNILLGRPDMAVPHHLGGFTRHAQCFLPPELPVRELFANNPHAFKNMRRFPLEQLRENAFDEYGIKHLPAASKLGKVALWDTPDCDSVNFNRYMLGLVEALSHADVIVYVTTQEKVSVESLLEWVAIVNATGAPLICCLNRTNSSAHQTIIADQRQRAKDVAERLGLPAPSFETIPFEFINEPTEVVSSILCDAQYLPGSELLSRVRMLLQRSNVAERNKAVVKFIMDSLPAILLPARTELESIRQWETAVKTSLEKFLADYKKNYLEQEDQYDAFKKVSLKILDLLDPPIRGLKPALKTVRWALSWPSKVILFFGRKILQFAFNKGEKASAKPKLDAEQQTYLDADEALLQQLGSLIIVEQKKMQHHPFWDELGDEWEAELQTLHQEFKRWIEKHFDDTKSEIDSIAQAIYDELAKNPIVLNGLRTSRVVSDVAMIFLTIFTAGHVDLVGDLVHDATIGPLLMALVQAVSQGLTENFVDSQKERLKRKLLSDAQRATKEIYAPRLLNLAQTAMNKVGILKLKREVIDGLPDRVERLARALLAQGGA